MSPIRAADPIERNLGAALKAAGRWAYAYERSPSEIRSQINEAVFEKIYIDNDGNVTSKLRPLFAELLRRSKNKKVGDVLNVPDDRVSKISVLAASLCPSQPNSPVQKGWGVRESNMVGVEGLEPPTLSV